MQRKNAFMNCINTFRVIAIAALTQLFFFSCKKIDSYNEIISGDQTKPGVVTNLKVDNFEGGAYITYALPKADNLLYVLAQYKINDSISRQVKSSYYTDTIRVDGFAQSKEYDVTLYAVSRAEVKSDPIVVKVHPETPPYRTVSTTLSLLPDFGGVHVEAINSKEYPIGVVVISPDDNNEWSVIEQVYSSMDKVAFSVRGYDTTSREFAAYVTDPWGNRSDTLYATINPLFEMEFDKSKFREFRLPTDPPDGYGWVMPNLWDNNIGTGYHTNPGSGMPQTFTFDMGVTGKLSRHRVWHRGGQYAYAHGNPSKYAMWGSNNPVDIVLPSDVDVSGIVPGDMVGNWYFLGFFVIPPKPSGKPSGDNTAEDLAANDAGFEFNFSLLPPPVRYIKFQTYESFSGGDFMHMMEITLWGTPQ